MLRLSILPTVTSTTFWRTSTTLSRHISKKYHKSMKRGIRRVRIPLFHIFLNRVFLSRAGETSPSLTPASGQERALTPENELSLHSRTRPHIVFDDRPQCPDHKIGAFLKMLWNGLSRISRISFLHKTVADVIEILDATD